MDDTKNKGDRYEKVYWPECELTKQLEELMITATMTDWHLMYSYKELQHCQWVVFSRNKPYVTYAIGMYLYFDNNTIYYSSLIVGPKVIVETDTFERDKELSENYLITIKTLRDIITNWGEDSDGSSS